MISEPNSQKIIWTKWVKMIEEAKRKNKILANLMVKGDNNARKVKAVQTGILE